MTRRNETNAPIKMRSSHMTFETFDALPREVRDALNYAAFKYSVSRKLKASEVPVFVRHILEIDAKQVEASYAQRELEDLGL